MRYGTVRVCRHCGFPIVWSRRLFTYFEFTYFDQCWRHVRTQWRWCGVGHGTFGEAVE